MSYCTMTDVQGFNPKRTYNATSTPTTTQVTEFIAKIAGEIDTVLQGRGLVTPVVSAGGVRRVPGAAQRGRGGCPRGESDVPRDRRDSWAASQPARLHWKQYQDGLKWLKEGTHADRHDSRVISRSALYGPLCRRGRSRKRSTCGNVQVWQE